MALEKQLADTDSVYCAKVTNSNQSSIFISNLGDSELDALFGAGYKSDDAVRLRLNRRNLAFNAVAHVVDGRTWYKRKSSDTWDIDAAWLNDRLSTLADVFANDEGVFIAYLNKDDHSTHRLYMKGMTSLPRDDGGKNIALRDFLFSGDVVVFTKLENGDVSFEIKIPDDPVISYVAKNGVVGLSRASEARQLITYGAPGSGKSWSVKEWTKNKDTIRTTFHPDSDYSTFVGSYKPSVEKDKFQTVVTAGERNAAGTLNKKDELFTQKRIVYKFVAQSFIKAYVDAWKYKAAANGGEATRKYLVIEEINRGNCAQIFGDLFQLLDRNDEGFSDYEIAADDDLQNYLAEQFADFAKQNETAPINLGVDAKLAKRILSGAVMLLPENLYIWATMNTSDQSLFPIDSAFKRRWEWKYMPIYDAQKDYKIVVGGDVYKWWDFLEKANALVQEFTDSEDKKLGYFFCKADASNTIPLEQFVGKVIFYLWNDVFKDAGFDHAAFDGDNGERLLFKTFFNPDGSPKAATVKKLMQNLGVASTAANASATPAV